MIVSTTLENKRWIGECVFWGKNGFSNMTCFSSELDVTWKGG